MSEVFPWKKKPLTFIYISLHKASIQIAPTASVHAGNLSPSAKKQSLDTSSGSAKASPHGFLRICQVWPVLTP